MHTTKSLSRIRFTLIVMFSILAMLLPKADPRAAIATTIPALQSLPTLQGPPALDYLKEHGLYDRLHNSIEASRYEIQRLPRTGMSDAWQAENPAHNLRAGFASGGVRLTPSQASAQPAWQMALRLRGAGYGARTNAVTTGPLRTNGNRIEYEHALHSALRTPHSAIKEWYVNTSAGIEQGFTLRERPGLSFGGEPLRVALAVTGELTASLANAGQTVVLARRDGLPVLRYDHLVAWDALGQALPSRMEVREAEIALLVDDTAAVYPLTIDPLFSEVKKLTASDAAANDQLGVAVGISGDTVVIGARGKSSFTGAAYIFARNQGGADNWGEVKKLTASDAAGGDLFGWAVEISADTVVVGAPGNSIGAGAAYIFGRNQGGADNWGEVKKLTASDAAVDDSFGAKVGISDDTIVVGAANKNSSTGAAYIFARNQGGADNWGQVKKLSASDAAAQDKFGGAVALSAETIVVGVQSKNSSTGAAYIFERNQGGADNWGEVKKLTASDAAAGDDFGNAVGISAETVVVGAIGKNSATGAAYIFARNQGGAGNWGQVKKLIASDGAADDEFGVSVGISAETVVVGAEGKNDFTGAAYLFERNQGGASNWGQVQKLTASDGAAGDDFGFAVAINRATVIAGADYKNGGIGAAYAFTNQCGQWTQAQKATASDGAAQDSFGNTHGVAVSGNTIVAGAAGKNSAAGQAYIFGRNQGGADNWGQVKIITASDAATQDRFGNAVEIDGDTVVVGAPAKNDFTGAAYIFARNQGGADNWGQVKKLTASDAATSDRFGGAVALSADTVVVGASGKNSSTGAAYIFARNQGGADNWGQVKKLSASDAAANDRFGIAVEINADTAVVGANVKNSNTGAAYIFERNQGGADNWGEVKKLVASDAAAGDRFGIAVGISFDTVVVGAFGKNSNTGAAYIFERNQGGANNWGQAKKLTASDGAANDFFGIAVGISTDTVVVGASSKNSSTGAAYIFGRNQGGADNWGQMQKLTASDAATDDEFGVAAAINGDTVVVGASGKSNFAGAAYIFNTSCVVIIPPPTISKAFSPTTIPYGGTATVTLTLTNPNATPLTNASFTDTLVNMSAAGGAAGGTCSGTTPSSLTAGATGLSFSGITIPASGSCTVTFDVTSTTVGGLPNQTSGVTTTQTPTAGEPSNTATLDVTCPTITLDPATLPAAAFNTAYSQTITASPSASYGFALTSGALPTGLTLASDGSLSGTPTQNGVFSFRVTATGFGGLCSGFRDYTLAISCVTINPASLPSGAVGTAYSQTISALPSAGYSFTVTSGALPVGLTLNAATGALTGTPAMAGSFNFTVTASAGGCSGQQSYTLTIACAAIALGALPDGMVGTGYTQTIGVTPAGSYSFSLVSGGLPLGLNLNSATGVISGTPAVTGTSAFTVKADAGNGCFGAQPYSVVIGCPAIAVNPASLPGGTTGTAYSQSLSATPAGGGYTFAVTTGSLPPGLNLNASTGSLSGTPAANGTFPFTITATGFGGCMGSQAYTVVIGGGGGCTTITLPASLPNGNAGQLYNAAATAAPAGLYNYTVTGGSLPPGLTLFAANGLLFGYPTAVSSYTFTITATQGACSGSQMYTVLIGAGMASSLTVFSDFDGDGKSDLSVFRGGDGKWLVVSSGNGQLHATPWGSSSAPYNDVTVSGDYDGDGKTDLGVFRRGGDHAGYWFIKRSSDHQVSSHFWGLGTDVPVPGDYDGDGKTDVAVWRGSAGGWYIVRSSDGGIDAIIWGTASAGDIPVPGDYDGDGKTDVAVFRRSTGFWYIRRSSDGLTSSTKWGVGTDIPVPGDYDGDNKTDIAIWRGSEGAWYIVESGSAVTRMVSLAAAAQSDVPVPGDYDGDGKADLAVWRPVDGVWLAIRSSNGANLIQQHGQSGDTPVPAKSVR